MNVSLALPRDANALLIPPSTLSFDKNGLRAATLGKDDKVLLKKVTVARDLGSTIEIGSGLAADDRVIQSPPDGIADGDVARVAKPPPKKDAALNSAQALVKTRARRSSTVTENVPARRRNPKRSHTTLSNA